MEVATVPSVRKHRKLITWGAARDEKGRPIPGEYVGSMRGYLTVRLEASRWRWRLFSCDRRVAGARLEEHTIRRAVLRRGHEVNPLDLSMELAERAARKLAGIDGDPETVA